jgi:hypothetical protein
MNTRAVAGLLIATAVGASCAVGIHPISPADVIGSGPASETTLRLSNACSISAAGGTYILEPGEYVPTHADSHGVYYAAPNGVIEQRNAEEVRRAGGIHMPNAGGRYYSFYSFWVALWEGDFSKLPLPDSCRTPPATLVFTRSGVEILP